MSTWHPYYKTFTNMNKINSSPKFNIATEPHYKIREYLEEDSFNIPNKKILNHIIAKAINKKKYHGKIDLNAPGNKDVLTDSDSEEHYVNENNVKKMNKRMFKQNGCTDLIIKKIESQAPQKNEEFYKFTNQNKFYANNDPIYGNKTLYNFNQRNFTDKKIINQRQPLYMQTEQNIYNYNYNNNNSYNNRLLTTSDINRKKRNNIENNYYFNSRVDLRQINYNKSQNKNPINAIKYSPYYYNENESSADAEQGSSSYVYVTAKKDNVKNYRSINNIFKENEFSSQSLSNNEEPYIKKNLEISTQKLRGINKYKIPLNRPTINELINLNYNNKGFSALQNKFNQKLIKNVIKIQSIWRGYFTRETINKNLNIIRFIIVLVENIKNKYLEYIAKIFYEMKYIKEKSEKNESYDDLLKDYNSLLNEYNKIENELNNIKKIQKINHFDKLNIAKKENNFEILNNNSHSRKDNIQILEPEQKDLFSIKSVPKRPYFRINYKKKKKENKYEEYIKLFSSNIKTSNEVQFSIQEKKPILTKKIKQKEKKTNLLIEESQKNMSIELKLQRKFIDNIISEHKNDIFIKSNITRNNSDKNDLPDLNQKNKSDNFIIYNNFNLYIKQDKEKPKINDYYIEKNNLFLKKSKKIKQDKATEAKEEINNKIDFSKNYEIEKKVSLEINPKEMKKSEKEKEILNESSEIKPYELFTEKAKKNMMKMILPIKLKGTIKEFIRKKVFKFFTELKDN